MVTNQKKKIVAVLNDLLFTVKIQEAAKRAGLDCLFVKTPHDALEQAKLNPALMIIDLNANSLDVLSLIVALKADEATKSVDLLGYVSHVQVDLKQTALNRGCDRVVARSALVQNLSDILRTHAE